MERTDLLTAPTLHRGKTGCFCSSLITAHYPGIRIVTALLAVNRAVSLACAGCVYIHTGHTTHLTFNKILNLTKYMQADIILVTFLNNDSLVKKKKASINEVREFINIEVCKKKAFKQVQMC